MVLLGVAVSVPVAFLAALTGVGAYRRSGSLGKAVVSAVGFPLAWISWYVVDELLRRPVGGSDRRVLAP